MRYLLFIALCVLTARGISPVYDSTRFRPTHGGVADSLRSHVTVSDVRVFGPFEAKTSDEAFDQDYLQTVGTFSAERIRSTADIKSLAEACRKRPDIAIQSASSETIIDFHNLLDVKRQLDGVPLVAYVASTVKSDLDRDCYLLLTSSDGAKVWLNGQPVFSDRSRHGPHLFGDCIKVALKKGENVLLARIPKFGTGWGWISRWEENEVSATETALASQDTLEPLLLEHAYIEKIKKITVRSRGVPPEQMMRYVIIDDAGTTVKEGLVSNGESLELDQSMPDGLYELRLQINQRTYSEHFVVGKCEKLYREITEQRASDVDLIVQDIRWDYLTNPSKTPENNRDRQWERSIASLIIDSTRSPLSAGMHLRGFKSAIDESLHAVRIYVPSSYQPQKKTGMIALLPTPISTDRPFIESTFLKSGLEAERYAKIAERLGVILVWPGYRNRPSGAPCELAHLDEALKFVESEYTIDKSRVGLLGACGGAALALRACVEWPTRFSGVALLNPVFGVPPPDEDTIQTFSSNPEFAAWAEKKQSAINSFGTVWRTPIEIIHDGAEPGHGSLSDSEHFLAIARKRGMPMVFGRITQGLSQHFDAWNCLMNWNAQQTRQIFSAFDKPVEQTARIESFFCRPFVVVKGTVGEGKEREWCDKLATEFERNWKETHHSSSPQITDVDFLETKIPAGLNVVLLGNERTNRVWALLRDHLPISVSHESAVIYGKSFDQPVFFHAMVEASPTQKILLIGGTGANSAAVSTTNLSTEAWYTYCVWEKGGEKVLEAHHGKFAETLALGDDFFSAHIVKP